MINTATDYKKILNTILDFGELMVSVGAEINRVEDTLTRLGLSYGAKRMNVFAVTNNIIVTLIVENGTIYTQSRRFQSNAGTDFTKLEKLNSLSRKKCGGIISHDEFELEISQIKSEKSNKLKICLGSMLAGGAFTLFFGGTVCDAAAAVVFAVAIYFLQAYFRAFCPNNIIFNLISSFIVGIGICAVSQLASLNADKVIIGDIMLLIPGIAFTNSMRDLLSGDTVTGIMRLVETVIWAAALAIGFVLAILAMGV
ncbi:MAG: threonine/serine exporter family protein [Clostridia bacterium]|nr:threonine/serine exporter family protein [Clostridia bacterium]